MDLPKKNCCKITHQNKNSADFPYGAFRNNLWKNLLN